MKRNNIRCASAVLCVTAWATGAAAQQTPTAQDATAGQATQQATQQATPPASARAITPGAVDDGRVPLVEPAQARAANGEALFAATLRTPPAAGSPEAPVSNVRFVVTNGGATAYSYLSARVTFYDLAGVRCGEGLFTINSLAAGEAAETDAPGLRLVCGAVAWRVAPVALVTNGAAVSNLTPGGASGAVTTIMPGTTAPAAPTTPRLTIDINGTVLPVQIGNPVEVEIGGERVRIVVRDARP